MRFRYWLYYGVCSVGLVGVIAAHIRFVFTTLFAESTAPIYEYVGRWVDKPLELFFFFMGAIALLFYSLAVYAAGNRLKKNRSAQVIWKRETWTSLDMSGLFLLCLINITIGFGYWKSWLGTTGILIGNLLWLLMIVFPVLITWITVKQRKILLVNFPATLAGMRKIYALFILVAFLQLVSLVWPMVAQPLNMMGEYLEIPTRTLVGRQYVDDATYYTEHQLLGIQPRYQRERDGIQAPRPNADSCLSIPFTPGVEQLLQATQNRAAFFYDAPLGLLCNTGPITPEDWLLIRQVSSDKAALARAETWLAKDIKRNNFWQTRVYTEEELDFIADNKFALEFQLNGIWVLHHHNFVLGPINEYALGKPHRDIFPQYGWLNMVVTSQVLDWLGGITYDRYFKVWYSYYIIYFIFLIGLFWLIFRQLGYVALAASLSVGLMSCIPFVWYFQGPGLNPVRHFFDVFIAAGFYLYLTKEKPVYLIAALGFSLLGILNNSQLGLACLGSLASAVGLAWFQHSIGFDRRLLLTLVATVLLGGWFGLGHPFWNAGDLNQYYLMGIGALPTSAFREIVILIVCGIADLMLWRHMGQGSDRFKYLVLFFLLYSQGSLLYSLWGSTMTHFLILATVHVTTVVSLMKLELDRSGLSIIKRESLVFFAFVASLFLLVYGAWAYSATQQKYESDFRLHEKQEWKLERAHFHSSMKPHFFENAAQLIIKHSTEPAIHIISEYDAIVPFLAKKYSAMPFFELAKFFITPRELAQAIEKIRQDRPVYLFVDADIERDHTIDVLDPRIRFFNHLQPLSVVRVKRMELLRQVFDAVKADYELAERGLLISVYRRK